MSVEKHPRHIADSRPVILSFAQFCRWLLSRAATGAALAVLVLAAWAWRLHTQDAAESGDFQAKRASLLTALAERRTQVVLGAEDARKHADELQAQARAQEQNAADAARAVEAHKALESSWQRWFGDREQQELNDKLLAEAQQQQTDATARADALKKELSDAAMSQERAKIEVARVDARIHALEKTSSQWAYYASAAWDRGRLVALAIVAFWILWTPALRAFFYYFVAPFIVRRKALRLAAPLRREEGVDGITTSEAGRTVTISLGANEVLRVKPELIESADDGLARRDGRWIVTTGALFPLTKILCRLTRLAELRKLAEPLERDARQQMQVDLNESDSDGSGSAHVPCAGLGVPPKPSPDGSPRSEAPDETPDAARETRALPGNQADVPVIPPEQQQQPAVENASTRMVVLRGSGKWKGAGPDLRKRRVSLTMVVVPQGASLVFRPRYLAGAVSEVEAEDAGKEKGSGRAPLAVRAHWRFFNWHAWVTGQFRFFEFAGPCRLIVAGQRGVRVEWIEEREDGLRPVARVEPWAVMGFDAALRYRPARTVSFWKYCKGARPLYDDLFIGAGMYLAQTTPLGEGRYDSGRMRRLAACCWRGFQKIFGM